MTEKPRKNEFWSTLPGILTGAGALVTAIAGLILGVFHIRMEQVKELEMLR